MPTQVKTTINEVKATPTEVAVAREEVGEVE